MTTRNKRKLAAWNKENCEEHPGSNLAQNSSAPRSQEDYITQVSEEIEKRVTKRLSKEFSRTENRILGGLARLDDFLMNPLLPGGSGTTPEPIQNASGINQGTNEDDSQNDPHPEASLFHGQREQNSGTERDYDNPHLLPSFLRLCSGMIPERFRTVSVPAASIELHLVLTEHPICGTLSCLIFVTVFYWLWLQSPRNLEWCIPRWFWERTCFVTSRSLDVALGFIS